MLAASPGSHRVRARSVRRSSKAHLGGVAVVLLQTTCDGDDDCSARFDGSSCGVAGEGEQRCDQAVTVVLPFDAADPDEQLAECCDVGKSRSVGSPVGRQRLRCDGLFDLPELVVQCHGCLLVARGLRRWCVSGFPALFPTGVLICGWLFPIGRR